MNRLDLERLERLLDSDANRRLPGIESLWTELSRASVVDPAEVPSDVVRPRNRLRKSLWELLETGSYEDRFAAMSTATW
jgi:hypothetical protein